MTNFSFISVTKFKLLFKILISVFSNLNRNLKPQILNIAVTYWMSIMPIFASIDYILK